MAFAENIARTLFSWFFHWLILTDFDSDEPSTSLKGETHMDQDQGTHKTFS